MQQNPSGTGKTPKKHTSQNAQAAAFDVVVLAASAGGHAAIGAVLRDLPADFSTPIIIMMHLGPESTGTVEVIGRRLPFTVEWIKPDSILASGKVLVSPPKSFVELLPDGTFVLSPNERGAVDKPMDRLLESVARSFGERSIGVILTGMQSDGSLGARQLHLAGGRMIVQSESTAEYADMPKAAIQAGATDLVVPLQDIGQVIGEMVAGTPRPKARSEIETIRQVFGDKGEIAVLAHEIDWSRTPLGPVINWPESLRVLIRTMLDNTYPLAIWWGTRTDPDL